MKAKRLLFIDAMRAFAILMMLQGHFVDSLLQVSYKDTTNPLFNAWSFFRGITPSLFFTVSGLVFVFLLMRRPEPFWQNIRVKKGIKRGLHLILWGYLLRLCFPALFVFQIRDSFWKVDVLHCIGISILFILGVYALHTAWKKVPFALYLLVGSMTIFLFYPTYDTADYSALPIWLANYFTNENGSVFTIFPWVGYAMLGGFIGATLSLKSQWAESYWSAISFIILGVLLHLYSSAWLMDFYHLTGWENFKAIANFNFIFIRLGHVFVMIGIFILLEKWHLLGKEGNTFLRIGQETLLIYKVHFVVLYGTWFGIGITYFFGRQLTPIPVALGAVAFIIAFILLIHYQSTWQPRYYKIRTQFIERSKEAAIGFWRASQLAMIKYKRRKAHS